MLNLLWCSGALVNRNTVDKNQKIFYTFFSLISKILLT